ncbi:hypothetical protein [Limosilactobacillus reuteri]|uniref:hypothetical protein n=1 Tax=Limosilactobacillus reuteri TaxID=1598 RepID=UPI001E55266D|nr:hypothetical protein [Limosilactobacillus reuteri]UFK64848.1 hypothetical protein IU404_00181 [Limosilactobacillus reuteri]UFK68853.1 hypothetical protein IVR12_01952 [Limosilactobacillus reuteri]UWF81021.1 MAG: hypothetical protein [Bacteriophage sp.]
MTFEEALKHEENNVPVFYSDRKYYVIGHNELTEQFTIRELSGNPLFTVPVDVQAEELS